MRLYPRDVRRYTYYTDGVVTGVAMRHLPTGIYTGLQPTLDDADQVLRACLKDHFAGIARAAGVQENEPSVISEQDQILYVR